jgi:hypothetical protein
MGMSVSPWSSIIGTTAEYIGAMISNALPTPLTVTTA